MEIRFYTITDTRNTIGKQLNNYVSTFVNLKYQDLNITTPVFMLKFMEYPNYNYLYIPALKRYYFIDNITIKTNNTFELQCKVDVLESFKDDILAGTGNLTKAESHNPYFGNYDSAENKMIDTYYSNKEITIDSTDKILITLGN